MSQYKISLHYPHFSFLLRVFESAGVVVIFSDFMKSVPLMPGSRYVVNYNENYLKALSFIAIILKQIKS